MNLEAGTLAAVSPHHATYQKHNSGPGTHDEGTSQDGAHECQPEIGSGGDKQQVADQVRLQDQGTLRDSHDRETGG